MTTMLKKGRTGLVGKLRMALGVGPADDVELTFSPTTREPGYPMPAAPPGAREAFDALGTHDAQTLKELGMRAWGVEEEDEHGNETPGGRVLWLFPKEWYRAIPAGFPIVDINFNDETFIPGETDDDIRFGMLAFGIIGPALPTKGVTR